MTDEPRYVVRDVSEYELDLKWLVKDTRTTGPNVVYRCRTREEAEAEAQRLNSEQDQQAWDEDEADMQRIKREWDAFDRDPPGS